MHVVDVIAVFVEQAWRIEQRILPSEDDVVLREHARIAPVRCGLQRPFFGPQARVEHGDRHAASVEPALVKG